MFVSQESQAHRRVFFLASGHYLHRLGKDASLRYCQALIPAFFFNKGVRGKRPSVTFDVMTISPFSHKQIQDDLEGESGS